MLRGAVDHVIAERRRNPSDGADLLSMLMSARDEETGEAMTDEQLRVEVTTFLLAGQETTSLALTWTWYLLSQHPAVAPAARGRNRRRARRPAARVRRSGEPAVSAHGDRRIDASVPAGVGLLATGAGRRSSSAGSGCRADGSRSSFRTSCTGFRPSGRIRTRSIPSASRPNAAPIGRSSPTCRSAPARGSASATSSR